MVTSGFFKVKSCFKVNYPVSITSFDLGKFDNHLTYQTVEADSSGTATFTFHGIEGTIQDSKILVASPMSRNKLKFIINTQISQEKINISLKGQK